MGGGDSFLSLALLAKVQRSHQRRRMMKESDAMTLLQLLETVDFAPTSIASYLSFHELGKLSATTRRLRYHHTTIGEFFYGTCTVHVPTTGSYEDGIGGGGIDSFVQRMTERASRLVTRVRLHDASYLDHASRFVNAKELEFLESTWKTSYAKELWRFPRLETLALYDSNACDGSFLVHLPRLRKLELCRGCTIVDAMPIASLVHLAHLAMDVRYVTNFQFLAGLVHLETLELYEFQGDDLRHLPLLLRLKTLKVRGRIRSLAGLEMLPTIKNLALEILEALSIARGCVDEAHEHVALCIHQRSRPRALCEPPAAANARGVRRLHSRRPRPRRPAPTARIGV